MKSSQELQTSLESFIEQTLHTRFEFAVPDFGAGPVELHRALVEIQTALSTVERFLSDSVRAKASVDRREAHVRMVWQEAWDRAISATNKKPSFGDYTTGKEKAAEANLATLNEARTLRSLQELQSFATEAVDVIRLHYYGLDKIRQDIRKRLDMSQTDYYSG
jgi:hypothetical protein